MESQSAAAGGSYVGITGLSTSKREGERSGEAREARPRARKCLLRKCRLSTISASDVKVGLAHAMGHRIPPRYFDLVLMPLLIYICPDKSITRSASIAASPLSSARVPLCEVASCVPAVAATIQCEVSAWGAPAARHDCTSTSQPALRLPHAVGLCHWSWPATTANQPIAACGASAASTRPVGNVVE